MTMLLQTAPSITRMGVDVSIFSCLLLMALYHFTLFLFRRSERITLAFATICFFWAAWCMSTPMYETNATVFAIAFPHAGSVVQLKLSALSANWSAWSILFYLCTLAPREFSPRLTRVLFWYTVVHSLFVVLGPIALNHILDAGLSIAVVFIAGYGMRGCISALRRKRSGFWIVSVGCLLLAVSAVHDVLVSHSFLSGHFLSPIAVLLFCFSQAAVLAFKLQQAFADVSEKLAMEQALEKQQKREAAALLEAEKERLARLRYQLNPHFLFNALTAVRGAIVVDSNKAREMVLDLADLCRSALTFGAEDLITIRNELHILELYLRIERTRLSDNLMTRISRDEDVLDVKIPTLLLQSLAENAIKHGRKTAPRQLEVKIDVKRAGDTDIIIRVSNTGQWIEPATGLSNENVSGFGLSILKERLQRLYPGRFSFGTHEADNFVTVEIRIPQKA